MEYKDPIEKKTRLDGVVDSINLDFIHHYHHQFPKEKELYQSLISEMESHALEKHYILELGRDLTRVRDKDDLIHLFSTRIKEFFYFNHSIITVIDESGDTYSPFLLNPAASPLVHHKAYDHLVASHFDLNEPFIQQVFCADGPVLFLLEEHMDKPGAPAFLRANYEVGLKTILMTPLRNKSKTIGFLHAYSDTDATFSRELISIIKGIAPQISNTLTNIIINEQREKKQRIDDALLDLGHEMAAIKDKDELLKVLCSGLGKFISFEHCMLTISEGTDKRYRMLMGYDSLAQSEMKNWPEPISWSVKDELYSAAAYSFFPVIFDVNIQRVGPLPDWYNYFNSSGSNEILMKVLPNAEVRKFALVLASRKAGAFDGQAIEIIESISGQLSSMLESLLSLEAIAKREREKSLLLEFSSEIAAVRTKENLQHVISSTLERLFETRLTMLSLLSDDGSELLPYMYDNEAHRERGAAAISMIEKHIPVGDHCCTRLLGSAEPVVFEIESHQAATGNSVLMSYWRKLGVKTACGSALRVGEQNLGVLWLITSVSNLEILQGICSQISIAIFNIRSYELLMVYKQQLEKENDHLHEQISTLLNFSEIVGDGSGMKSVYEKMELVSPSNSTVIILGETGTGKELIARAIHNSSLRSQRNLVKVNCAALPAHLIESELFGHEKGAFTGATERRSGKFELADGGTIFLDEIGELPLDLQVKLLRVIQEREFERVGGSNVIKVDIRVIAATNRDLQAEVNAGRFRADLYYRLNVFPISLPALRERPEDIPALAHYFLQRAAKRVGVRVKSISDNVMQALLDYHWPGNIRELEHLIERSILLGKGNELSTVHLPGSQAGQVPPEELPVRTLEEMERLHIVQILKNCSGKISGSGGAADLLEIPASTLHSKMKKLSISRMDYHPEAIGVTDEQVNY
jgi:transcriptional regulator with GAF, ATPase, and Fis domain